MRLRTAALVSALALAGGDAALAQEKAAAEAQFQDGLRLVAAGDHAAACTKFAASDKLDPSVGARLQIGKCSEKQGKTASAWLSFKAAQSLANQRGDASRADVARQEAARLEPSLTYVVIRRVAGAATPNLSISFDGVAKAIALLDQRFPVDPGEHTIAAQAVGFQPWQTTVTASRPGDVLAVEIPALEPEVTARPEQPEPRQPDPIAPTPAPQPQSQDRPGSTRKLAAYGVGAAGVALVGTGVLFGVLAKSKYDTRTDNGECDSQNVCSDAGLAIIDSAQSRALVATILVPAGLAAIGAGVYLLVTAPDEDDGVALSPVVAPDRVGLLLGGRF